MPDDTEKPDASPLIQSTGSRCGCGEDSTGWMTVKCCNICGRPHDDEELDWRFEKMKDHEIAQLVNLIKAEIEPICSNQSLRFRISEVVTNYFHANDELWHGVSDEGANGIDHQRLVRLLRFWECFRK